MQKQALTWNIGPAVDIELLPAREPSPFALLPGGPGCRRRIRVRMPLLRRPVCLTKRAILAALREAELASWEATGGDYLRRRPADSTQP